MRLADSPTYRTPSLVPAQARHFPRQHRPSAYLNRLRFAQDEHMQHVHIGVLVEDVGLGVMLEVAMVPPVGGGTLWGGTG